jgi:hypothetical protein
MAALQVLIDAMMLVLLGGCVRAPLLAREWAAPGDRDQVMSRRTTSRVPAAANASA